MKIHPKRLAALASVLATNGCAVDGPDAPNVDGDDGSVGRVRAAVNVPEDTAAKCGDGVDNDGDGFKDCADADCTTLGDCDNDHACTTPSTITCIDTCGWNNDSGTLEIKCGTNIQQITWGLEGTGAYCFPVAAGCTWVIKDRPNVNHNHNVYVTCWNSMTTCGQKPTGAPNTQTTILPCTPGGPAVPRGGYCRMQIDLTNPNGEMHQCTKNTDCTGGNMCMSNGATPPICACAP